MSKKLLKVSTTVMSWVRDQRGDAGTNWLIGIGIAVVLGNILLALANPAVKGWWTSIAAKITTMIGIT